MNDLKKILSLISICIFTNSYSQIYQYTGKAWSLNTAINPFSSTYDKVDNITINNISASIGASKMIYKGIFPTIAYTYNKSTISDDYIERNNTSNFKNHNNDFHSINSSILIQKHLITLQNRKIKSHCFKQTMSIFIAPEYNYNFTTNRSFEPKGDFSVKAGICIFNSYTGTTSRNILWDLYYRKGITPSFKRLNSYEKSFYKDEIGVQVRILFRQRYDFSK